MSVFLKRPVASDLCGVSSKNAPSTTGTNGNSQIPNVPHSLSTKTLASFSRKQSTVSESFLRSCGQPTASARRSARRVASSRVTNPQGAVGDPLSRIARWNRSRERGDKRCNETETAPGSYPKKDQWKARVCDLNKVPALSPNKQILFGSPPNRRMLSRTHRRARFWSNNPELPGASGVPKYMKPRLATRYCMETMMTFSSAAKVLWS